MAKENTVGTVEIASRLEYIMAVFKLQAAHLARLLGSPQDLDLWQQGHSPSEPKVEALYLAAKRFEEGGLEANYHTKHRLVGGGLTFLEALAQDPQAATARLIALTEIGKRQRERLEELLAKRPRPKVSVVDHLPLHYPGE